MSAGSAAVIVALAPAAIPVGREMLLPPFMRDEIERFLVPADRQRSLAAKLLLRQLLMCHWGAPPDVLTQVRKTPLGQPTMGAAGPFLSLSHCGEYVACAVSDAPVGIDIEAFPVADLEGVVTAFSPAIAATIRTADDPHHAFVHYWTRAESVLKAMGTGLSVAPAGLEFAGETVRFGEVAFRTWEIETGHPDYLCHVASTLPSPCPLIIGTHLNAL